jgi:hypothetical protein
MSLLPVAVYFERKEGDIDWQRVYKEMGSTSRTIAQLKSRYNQLKFADTALLRSLPSTYVAGSSLQGAQANRSLEEIYTAIEKIFGHLTIADVRQPSGQTHLNAGEIAPVGVTALLEVINLTPRDVLLDIGSGTGSIIAQVVLQSPVIKAIGIEIQEDLARKSREAIEAYNTEYQRLYMAQVYHGDLNSVDIIQQATVFFCNNILFEEGDKQLLKKLSCQSMKLRLIALSERMCPRCTDRCSDSF